MKKWKRRWRRCDSPYLPRHCLRPSLRERRLCHGADRAELMAAKCRNNCGRDTNASDRVCVICRMDSKSALNDMYTTLGGQKIEEEEEVANVGKSRICSDCSTEFEPTSNVQKRCLSCAQARKAENDRLRKEAKSFEPARAGRVKAGKADAVLPENFGKVDVKQFGLTCPDSQGGVYIVVVDFKDFPELHSRLTAMAKDEIRRPEDQLLYLLRGTLQDMEATV